MFPVLLGADQTGAVSVIGHPAAVIVSRELAAGRLQPAPANQGQFANIPQHFSNQGTATFEPFQTFSFNFFQVTTLYCLALHVSFSERKSSPT